MASETTEDMASETTEDMASETTEDMAKKAPTTTRGRIAIPHRWRAKAVWEGEADSLRDAVERAVRTGANLTGAKLAGAKLAGAGLMDARLDGANLTGAKLAGADLAGANLTGAKLAGAKLMDARLDGADLAGANLTGADLAGAKLAGADLTGADLTGAKLMDADLRMAHLKSIRKDLWEVLDAAPKEVGALLAALREGRVDGSTYYGDCCCLVGTIANARGVEYSDLKLIQPDAKRHAERWFLAIRPGNTPDRSQVAAITVEWVEAWLVRAEGAADEVAS